MATTTPTEAKQPPVGTSKNPASPQNSKPAPEPGRVSLAEQAEVIRVMWYSDPGKGKSTNIASMAKLGRYIHIDPEKRLKAAPLRRLGIPVENIEPFTDVSYEKLEQLSFDVAERLSKGEEIVGIGWDAAGETARQFTQTLVDKAVVRANAANKPRLNPYSTEIGDYGDMTEQMRRILRRFRDLNIHLAIAAHVDRSTDEEGGVLVAPAFTPAVYKDMMGYMDLVMHCRVELIEGEEEYSALCRHGGRWITKDALGVMPRVLINPTFDRVMQYVNGTLTSKNDPIQQAGKAARERMAEEAAKAAS
jgi:hypothetical protein